MRSKPKSNRTREKKVDRRREKRELIANPVDYTVPPQHVLSVVAKPEVMPLRALNAAQGQYLASIIANTITFCVGPQGTGKSFIAAAYAADQLKLGLINKLIITRPVIEAGRNMGPVPGDIAEKYAPFMAPFNAILEERLGKTFFEYLKKTGRITATPLEFMRGATFDNSLVILDEAQNATKEQLTMFLTRIGKDTKLIIDGSITQRDIKNSGLEFVMNRLQSVNSIAKVEFTLDDIVRNGIIREILINLQE